MNEQEAKRIIREDPDGNIRKRIEAINVALSVDVLGPAATMKEIYRWAEGKEDGKT